MNSSLKSIFVLLALIFSFAMKAQDKINADVSLQTVVGSADRLAFWARANKRGVATQGSGAAVLVKLSTPQQLPIAGGNIGLDLRASGAYLNSFGGGSSFLPDEVYAGLNWKTVSLYAGMKPKRDMYNGVSISAGDVTYSGNARNLPGYRLTVDQTALPFLGGRFKLAASWGDFILTGPRYVNNPLLHNEELYLTVDITNRLSFTLGLEDWGIWAGQSNSEMKISKPSIKNYIRMALGLEGGDDASLGDQVNALGNHVGRTLFKFSWDGDGYTLSLAKDSPYEDASGKDQRNFPDGIWSLYWGNDDKDAWVSDLIYDFVYLLDHTDTRHDRPATEEEMSKQDPDDYYYGKVVLGGCDNYFNHGQYRTGWTHYGNTIGIPLVLPRVIPGLDYVRGVENNMLVAHHFGIKGKINRKWPYRLLATYSINQGLMNTKSDKYDSHPKQFSLGFEGELPALRKVPISLSYGLYADMGQLYRNNISVLIGIKYSIL